MLKSRSESAARSFHPQSSWDPWNLTRVQVPGASSTFPSNIASWWSTHDHSHIRAHTYMNMCAHMYEHVRIHTHIWTSAQTHIHRHIHAHTYTCTHAHIHRPNLIAFKQLPAYYIGDLDTIMNMHTHAHTHTYTYTQALPDRLQAAACLLHWRSRHHYEHAHTRTYPHIHIYTGPTWSPSNSCLPTTLEI